jgi:hypothetical protein
MTAQIVLGNGHSIVVASDGASTMGGRTYGSAKKIAPFPTPYRIAVLHSGGVQLHGVSVPALLENWAASISTDPLVTVQTYSESFRKYLQREIPNFSSNAAQLMDYMGSMYYDLMAVRDRLTAKGGTVDVATVAQTWDEALVEMRGDRPEYSNDSWVETTYRMLHGTGPENSLLVEAKEGQLCRQVDEWECSFDGILAKLFGEYPASPEIASKGEMYIKTLMLYHYPHPGITTTI